MSHDAAESPITNEDLPLELQLQKDPNNREVWRNYILQWRRLDRPVDDIIWLYERFVLQIDSVFEIWQDYIQWLHSVNISGVYSEFILSLYQRCHDILGKFDSNVTYVEYLTFAIKCSHLTHIRQSFNLALQNLKDTESQDKIWGLIIPFVSDALLPLTENSMDEDDDQESTYLDRLKIIIYQTFFQGEEENPEMLPHVDIWSSQILEKYLLVCPIELQNNILLLLYRTNDSERIKKNFDKYLIKNKYVQDNIPFSLYKVYLKILTNLDSQTNEYVDLLNTLRNKYSEKIVDLITLHCEWLLKQKRIDELEKYITNELQSVLDFTQFVELFNYLIDFKQAYINTILDEQDNIKDKDKIAHWTQILTDQIASLNKLIDSKDLQINDLKLRLNINNVDTWLERVSLFENIDDKCQVFTEALLKINPLKVPYKHEKLSTLWCSYIDIYWNLQKFDTARELYETAIKVPFPRIIDLEKIYLHWINNELNQFGLERSIELLNKILQIPENFEMLVNQFENDLKTKNFSVPVNAIIFNSLKLWSAYIDQLEAQSMNTDKMDNCIKAYEDLIKIKLITPKMFLNYAAFLHKFNQFGKSYAIYQRALTQFSNLEIKYLIWVQYLTAVLKDRSSTEMSIEEIRALFDESIETFQGQDSIDYSQICSMYNSFEEPQNLINSRSIQILISGAENISNKFMNSKLTLWRMAIDKTKKILPGTACRPLYQSIIEIAPVAISVEYCIEFASMECDHEEYRRTREILQYGAKLLPPLQNKKLWDYWDQFEIEHGTKETYKDMLLLKKKLQDEMALDTETVSKQDGNISFVASSKNKLLERNDESTKNENEIELDL